MKLNELKALVGSRDERVISVLSRLYANPTGMINRILGAIDSFAELFGEEREVFLLSVPGRSEILGNHTDHNHGKVLAGAIDKDAIAIASVNGTDTVNMKSEGYDRDTVDLSRVSDKSAYGKFTSSSLILGTAAAFKRDGYAYGGFDCYLTSDVLRGSGISSSAAFEVMIGNIFNHLFNGGSIDNKRLAVIAQYAENEYFGKPCGLMDQMACAVGGFVYMDFLDPTSPVVTPISLSLSDHGYALCIVNTGGNHADLNEDYASVPSEMKGVAAMLGGEVLRPFDEATLLASAASIRESLGDRALLRALHFVRENKRVDSARAALERGDISSFFNEVNESGRSSFEYLQNVYTTKNVREQGLSLALCITDGMTDRGVSAFRVHGGGFAGTVQAYVRLDSVDGYRKAVERVFGEGAVMCLGIRSVGATKIF